MALQIFEQALLILLNFLSALSFNLIDLHSTLRISFRILFKIQSDFLFTTSFLEGKINFFLYFFWYLIIFESLFLYSILESNLKEQNPY